MQKPTVLFVFSQICRSISTVNRFFFRRSTSTVDKFCFVWIDLDGRYRQFFVYYQSNRPSILTVILLQCNRTERRYQPYSPVGAIKPTIDIDRDWLTGRLKSTNRTDDTCETFHAAFYSLHPHQSYWVASLACRLTGRFRYYETKRLFTEIPGSTPGRLNLQIKITSTSWILADKVCAAWRCQGLPMNSQ